MEWKTKHIEKYRLLVIREILIEMKEKLLIVGSRQYGNYVKEIAEAMEPFIRNTDMRLQRVMGEGIDVNSKKD